MIHLHLDLGSLKRVRVTLLYFLFQERDLLRKFQINPRTLISFCLTLEDHYHRSVPYHNNVHAADVTQSINCLLNTQALEVSRYSTDKNCDTSFSPYTRIVYSINNLCDFTHNRVAREFAISDTT